MISETRRRLKEWGIWACGGEPQLSSMFRSMFGRGAQDLREMPPHIQQIDHIICIAPPDIRHALIKFYGTGGTFQDKAISFGLDRKSLRRKIDRADYYVHSTLDNLPEKTEIRAQNGLGVHQANKLRVSEPVSRRAHNSERPRNSVTRIQPNEVTA
jgi:hypothetical protein